MVVYSYLIEHDLGLAPNPFGQYCTLAVCKSEIRRSKVLAIGDWVIGTGSKALEETTGKKLVDKLIYAMKVTERIIESRKGISPLRSHRTVRESLPSYGSSCF